MSYHDQPGRVLSNSAPTLPFVGAEEDDDEEAPEVDLTGTILEDRYRLLHRLGAGGMGVVYAAEHIKLGTRMAVKVLKREYSLAHQTHRKRFLREAKAAAMLRDPNIIQITDFGQTSDDIVYFVMELVEGHDLAQLIRQNGRLPWPRVRGIVLQVASALELAHQHRIIHRDVKPSNCVVFDEPRTDRRDLVKVLDFGIAKLEGGNATTALTGTRELFGTVAYMAPELVEGTPASAASDIYALGVMLFQMLTGELPFRGPTPLKVLTLHMTTEPPRPSAIEPTIPPDVEEIVLRCLAKEPGERFERMADVAAALREAGMVAPTVKVVPEAPLRIDQEQPATLPAAHQSEPLHRGRRGSWWLALGGIGAMVAGIGGSVWLGSSWQDAREDGGGVGLEQAVASDEAPELEAPALVSMSTDTGGSVPARSGVIASSSSTMAVVTMEIEADTRSDDEAAGNAEPPQPDRVQDSASSPRRRPAPSSASGRSSSGADGVGWLKKKLRRSCRRLATEGSKLTIKMPMGSDGKALLVTVTGGSKELNACARELLLEQELPGSSHRVIGFELEL